MNTLLLLELRHTTACTTIVCESQEALPHRPKAPLYRIKLCQTQSILVIFGEMTTCLLYTSDAADE